MRLARFNGGHTGLVLGQESIRIADVAESVAALKAHDPTAAAAIDAVLPPGQWQSWGAMIQHWSDVRGPFEKLTAFVEDSQEQTFDTHAIGAVDLDPPLASLSPQIFALAGNTAAHAVKALKMFHGADVTEAEVRGWKSRGLPPSGFTVWPSTVVGSGATVAPPAGTRRFDYEGECAAYVKSGAKSSGKVELWGYAAFNDFSVRDGTLKLSPEAPHSALSFNSAKNFDTGNSCGPWVVVHEGQTFEDLRCITKVNGEVRQDWKMSDMIFGFEETLSGLSNGITLRPGDMVASGTGAGVAVEGGVDGPNYLRPGDVVEVILDGAGILRNTVGTWAAVAT